MVFGGPLCDAVGMAMIARLAFVGHLAGILLTIFAWDSWSLFTGTLLFGIANGSVEAACNPLIAALYPDNKTTKLNHFHVWFPGGIVIGGLVAFLMAKAGLGWKAQFASMLVPLAAYGALFLGQSMPPTERVSMGLSGGAMVRACLNPIFLLMVVCMLMTAATELGPGQWIPSILENAGVSGILVLVWITGLMAVGRQFAGPFVHRLQPLGMLLASAVLSAAGLYLMSRSSGGMLFVAATVFAFGVCFFWPTMLGFVNERFPATGALGLAIMGGAGMLSAGFVLPVIGRFYDQGIAARVPEDTTTEALKAAATGSKQAAQWMGIQAGAGLEALGKVAVLPVVLAVVFAAMLVLLPRTKSAH
jgi:MFS family permease